MAGWNSSRWLESLGELGLVIFGGIFNAIKTIFVPYHLKVINVKFGLDVITVSGRRESWKINNNICMVNINKY